MIRNLTKTVTSIIFLLLSVCIASAIDYQSFIPEIIEDSQFQEIANLENSVMNAVNTMLDQNELSVEQTNMFFSNQIEDYKAYKISYAVSAQNGEIVFNDFYRTWACYFKVGEQYMLFNFSIDPPFDETHVQNLVRDGLITEERLQELREEVGHFSLSSFGVVDFIREEKLLHLLNQGIAGDIQEIRFMGVPHSNGLGMAVYTDKGLYVSDSILQGVKILERVDTTAHRTLFG